MATYIKLNDLAKLVRMFYDTDREDIFDQEFWDAFVERFPTQVVESIPTDTKERDELLRMAERFKVAALIGNLTRSAQDCVDIAVDMRNAVNKACETKEDNK